jgi:CubicO group peptidase (beta-lactamase class C family)
MIELTIEKRKKIDEFVVNTMQGTKSPGVVLGFVIDGKPAYSKAYGFKDLEAFLPITTKSLYSIGSTSKSFTATAIMQLFEQGKLKLDDPVHKYLDFQLGFEDSPIKIHHLLSHTSGVPELDGANYGIDRLLQLNNVFLPLADINDFMIHLNEAAKSEVKFRPGEKFFYNNDCFTCLQLIVEKISGLKFPDYIKQHIFLPCGMNRATYLKLDCENDPEKDMANFYLKAEPNEFPKKANFPFYEGILGAGGVLAPLKEMQNYMCMLLNEGTFGENQILSSESLKKMWTPNMNMPMGAISMGYGYAWMKLDGIFDQSAISHGGNIIVGSNEFTMIPDLNVGVIVGSNYGFANTTGIGMFALATLLDVPLEKLSPTQSKLKKVQQFVGDYYSYKGVNKMKVEFDGGSLYATIVNDGGTVRFPLIVGDFEQNIYYPVQVFESKFAAIQFYIDKKTKEIYATYERYIFHKQ